jgi:5-formyltetrahydrofolate cyclo-ligase
VDYTKSELRNVIRDSRTSLANRLAVSELFATPEMKSANVIASYVSYGNEPTTGDINQEVIDSGRILLLPRTLADNSLEFVAWNGSADSLKLNGKVLEPTGVTFLGDFEVMILPALAIDKSGNRLGQGGGSFDRALENFSGWSVALINQSELVDQLPIEPHDQRVKAALTEFGLTRFNLN